MSQFRKCEKIGKIYPSRICPDSPDTNIIGYCRYRLGPIILTDTQPYRFHFRQRVLNFPNPCYTMLSRNITKKAASGTVKRGKGVAENSVVQIE